MPADAALAGDPLDASEVPAGDPDLDPAPGRSPRPWACRARPGAGAAAPAEPEARRQAEEAARRPAAEAAFREALAAAQREPEVAPEPEPQEPAAREARSGGP